MRRSGVPKRRYGSGPAGSNAISWHSCSDPVGNMDVELLRIFVEVARRGSFAGVARDRDTDPSSISRAITQLEREIGFRLFQRTTRHLATTEAGALYLARVEPLLDELAQARDEAAAVSGGPIGMLRLTASVAFGHKCLTPLLPLFRKQFPQLQVELLMTDVNLDLVTERIDLAIRLAPSVTADVIGTKLLTTQYRVCASPEYLRVSPVLADPADLSNHRVLRFSLRDFRSRWLFRKPDETTVTGVQEIQVDGDIVSSNALVLRDLAVAGSGPALLANWLVDDDIAAGRLVPLFPEYQVTATSFDTAAWLLYPSRTYLPSKVRVTIDFLKAQFR